MKKIFKRLLGAFLVFVVSLSCLGSMDVYAGTTRGTVYDSRTGYFYFTLGGATYKVDMSVGTQQVNTHYLVSYTVTCISGTSILTGYTSQVWTESDYAENSFPDIYSPGDREYRMKLTINYSKPGYHIDATSSNCCQSCINAVTESYAEFYISTADCGITRYDGEKHNTLSIALTQNEYTLKVNPNGGSFMNTTGAYTFSPKLKYDTPNWCVFSTSSAKRTGYTLTGFTDAISGGNKVYDVNGSCVNGTGYWTNGVYKATKDLTAYAQWSANQYTLKVDPNGGSFMNSTGVYTFSPNLIYDSSNWYGFGAGSAKRTGYTLDGFYSAPSGGVKVYDSSGMCVNGTGYWVGNKYKYANNLTVYAHWIPNKYTETFDANGGTSTYSSLQVTYDSSTYDVIGAPTRDHYLFNGWYTTKTGGTQIYDSTGNIVNDGTYWVSGKWKYLGNLSLFAQWSLDECVTSFDSQGGSSVDTRTDKIADKYSNLETPTREGWDFLGWYTEPNGEGVKVEDDSDIPDTEYTTLYANWSVHVSDVTVNCSVNQSKVVYNKGNPVYIVKFKGNDVSGVERVYTKSLKWVSTDSNTKSVVFKVNSGVYDVSVISTNEYSTPSNQSVDVSKGNDGTITFSKDEVDYSKYTGNALSVKSLR